MSATFLLSTSPARDAYRARTLLSDRVMPGVEERSAPDNTSDR